MRRVPDTNTALSGLLWDGTPGRWLEAGERQRIELISSAALLAELQGVMAREKFARQLAQRKPKVADLFDGYAAWVMIVALAAIAPTSSRDPADDQVLVAALAAQAV